MLPISAPLATKALSALDNESSVWPLLTKDMIDNTGRSVMEYRRGGNGAYHAGRERVIEEFATTAVWLGGRKALEKAFIHPLMRYAGLDPQVDPRLVLAKHVPTWLLPKAHAYKLAHLAGWTLGTLLPVLVIGWVIPPFNQQLTRVVVGKEREMARQKALIRNHAFGTPFSKAVPHLTARFQQPGYAAPRMPYSGALRVGTPYATKEKPQVRFGQAMQGMLHHLGGLATNDRFNTVAIDAGISSGRLYNGRNWLDRLEIAVRESSIIAFLYVLGPAMKSLFGRVSDRRFGTMNTLTMESLAWLRKARISPAQWREQQAFLQNLNEKTAFETISKVPLNAKGAFNTHPILELARLQGKLQVMHDPKRYQLDWRKFLDIRELQQTLSRKTGLVNALLKHGETQKLWQQCLQRTMRSKLLSLGASYAVSGLCLAWLAPMFQHWLTYRLSGSVDFPGTRRL